jgi:Protein of unknown function (DUF2778)
MWIYDATKGTLSRGNLIGLGYSGYGTGRNNSAMEGVPDLGPIPRGEWSIVGPPTNTTEHGPYVLRLEPKPGTSPIGRSGFLIHGDSRTNPGCASHGCIVVSRAVREMVWQSGDRDLGVI